MSDDTKPAVDADALAKEAAEQLTALKTILESARQEMATAKGAVEEIQRTTTADANVITKNKQEIEKLKTESTTTFADIQSQQEELQDAINELSSRKDALKSILSEIEALKASATEERNSVEENIKAILAFKTQFDTLSEETQSTHDALEEKQTAVDGQIKEINKANDAVKEVHAALLTDTEEKKSIKTAIGELQTQITETFADAKRKSIETATAFSKLHSDLEQKILSLLPSAGAAGLASTYYDAKAKYGVTSFYPDPGKPVPFLKKNLGQNPASFVATIAFYLMFLGPIAVIIWLFFDLLGQIADKSSGEISNQYLIFRALIAVPLGTVSLFGYSSLRLYRRLYEEYNYKQRVMELYTSFSKEIEDDEEQKKALIAIMLKAVADKPSLGMHRYDGIGTEGKLKLDINAFINRILGATKPSST